MEDKNPENLLRATSTVSLTAEEKSAVRSRLVSYMELKPLRTVGSEARQPATMTAPSWFGTLALHRGIAVAALVVAVTLSAGGVSYAAESALPGDALYPIKVSVNEEVRAAFAANPEAKAAWEAERAERRLVEAEGLAERGRLNPAARAAVEAAFRRHAERTEARLAAVAESGNAAAAAEVAAHLEGSIEGHRQVIAEIVARKAARTTEQAAARAAAKAERERDDTAGSEDQEENDEIAALGAMIAEQAASARRLGDRAAERAVERSQDRAELESRRERRRQEQVEKVIERANHRQRSDRDRSDDDRRDR